jgi:hypothetical protein
MYFEYIPWRQRTLLCSVIRIFQNVNSRAPAADPSVNLPQAAPAPSR